MPPLLQVKSRHFGGLQDASWSTANDPRLQTPCTAASSLNALCFISHIPLPLSRTLLFCLVTLSSKSLTKCLPPGSLPDTVHQDTFHQSLLQACHLAQPCICGFNLPHSTRNFSRKRPCSMPHLAHIWRINEHTEYLGICFLRSSITMLPNPRSER